MIEVDYFFRWQKKTFVYYALLLTVICITADFRTITYSLMWVLITFLANLVAFALLKFISNNKITGNLLTIFPNEFFTTFMILFHVVSPLLLYIDEPRLEGIAGFFISIAFMLPALMFFLFRKVIG